jgi:hypothetical protein
VCLYSLLPGEVACRPLRGLCCRIRRRLLRRKGVHSCQRAPSAPLGGTAGGRWLGSCSSCGGSLGGGASSRCHRRSIRGHGGLGVI